jgi:tetratricopeptide (TPR) repeat protein
MSKSGLGIELVEPFAVGPISVVTLSIALPGVRFPIDLSGGVARFRHRRGTLLAMAVEMSTTELCRWAAPRLKGFLGEASPSLSIIPVESGVLVGLSAADAAMAFDVLVVPMDGDLGLVPVAARGVGLRAPPHVVAMRVLGALCAPFGAGRGGMVVLAKAATQLSRHVLSAAGGRAPGAADVRWTNAEVASSRASGRFVLTLGCRAHETPPALGDRLLRGLEVAELAREADAAALAGDLDAARRRYLEILDRAPRHPELCERIAWIDALEEGRAEAALSLLIEATPAAFAGILGGKLLAAVDDPSGARAAYVRAAETEPYGPLSALTWLLAAEVATGRAERLTMLDEAVARAPSHPTAHSRRLVARLEAGDVEGARADVEHLEALATGARDRLSVCRDAADAFLRRGFPREAYELYERGLRHAPGDAQAVLGLGRSLRAAGQPRRAVDLFARASLLATQSGRALYEAELELARGLAEIASDRPAAIARARAIPENMPESIGARFLEGRWRHELGDGTGASLAFGRLRQAVEAAPGLKQSPKREEVAEMLGEAATIEETSRGDLASAERCLELALRLSPRDPAIGARFRRVAALVAKAPSGGRGMLIASGAPAPVAPSLLDESVAASRPEDGAEDLDAKAAVLTDRIRANPSDHATAMELASVLERLGHNLELIALLSARMDEGGPDVQRELFPVRQRAFLRVAQKAREDGRVSEAELYEMMAAAGEGGD